MRLPRSFPRRSRITVDRGSALSRLPNRTEIRCGMSEHLNPDGTDDLFWEMREFLAEYDAEHSGANGAAATGVDYIDANGAIIWEQFAGRETGAEWLVKDMWPTGRSIHLYAQ